MRKVYVAVAGVAVVGAAYLGGVYVSGGEALSRLHQAVDTANARQSQVRFEIQDEHHGVLSSTAKVTGVSADKSFALDAPVELHHGLRSTDIDSRLEIKIDGQNVLQQLGSKEERILVHAHAKHNRDGRGSDIHFHVPGKLVLGTDEDDSRSTEEFDLGIARGDDGSLTIDTREAASQSVIEGQNITSTDVKNRLTYDAQWADSAIALARQSGNLSPEELRSRAVALFLSQLPDMHIDAKQIALTGSSPADKMGSIDGLKLDLVREGGASAVSHLTIDVKDVNAMGKHYKGNTSMKLDQSVVDTLMSVASSAAANGGHVSDEDAEAKVVALLQTSPRFVIDNLDVSGDDLKPVSMNGYVTIDGKDLKNIEDVQMHAPQLVKGQLIIRNVPEFAVMMAPMIGLTDIKAGDTVTVDVEAGHVKANGKTLF